MNMRNNRAIAAAITFGAIAMLIAWADVSLAADKKSGGSRFGDILGGLGTLAGGLMPIGQPSPYGNRANVIGGGVRASAVPAERVEYPAGPVWCPCAQYSPCALAIGR